MTASPGISVECYYIMDSTTEISLQRDGGKLFGVLSMEIDVPAEELASLWELINAKPAMLRVTLSAL